MTQLQCWLLFLYITIIIPEDFQKQAPEVFCKKVFLDIPQNSQENTCARTVY